MTRVVYLAHPVAPPCRCGGVDCDNLGPVECNTASAHRWLRWALGEHPDVAFCVPWLPYVAVLPEDGGASRARGMRDDIAMALRCDEIWLVGGRVSSGMAQERDAMLAAGKVVVDLTDLGPEAPVAW